MTGFEPGSSGIGSDRSANCATTTALYITSLLTQETTSDLVGKSKYLSTLI